MPRLLQMTGPIMDIIYHVREFPRSGQEAEVTGFSMTAGGGINALAAGRAAGIDVRLGGSLGTGPLASTIRGELDKWGVEPGRPANPTRDQGCCTVLIEPGGERSFIAWPGAEGELCDDDLAALSLSDVDYILISGYSLYYPGSRQALVNWIPALPRDIHVLFDPSPLVQQIPNEYLKPILARADWISANSDEAAFLAETPDAHDAARSLATDRAGAIVRRGERGCVLATRGQTHDLPAHPVEVVDTNGAGDCHIGSFVAELALTSDPLHAARYANIAAALSITRHGPATPPTREEVLAGL